LFKKKKKPLYLIEIGRNYLRLAVASIENDRFSLKNLRSFRIENGIKNPAFWTLFEKRVEEIYNPDIKLSYLLFSPPYAVSYAKTLPPMPRSEALSHCIHVITHSAEIKTSNCYLDHKVSRIEGQDLIAGMASGVIKEVADRIISILSKLDIEVLKIETSIIATEALFSNLKLISKESSIWVLRLEDEYSEMFVLKDRFVVHYETVDFGLKDIEESLIRTVYTKTGPIEINRKEAESIIGELGYPLGEGSYLIKDRQRLDILNKVGHEEEEKDCLKITYQQLRILMSPALEVLCEKLNAFIQEYKHDFPAEKISGIYLFGEGGGIKGLGEFIEGKLSLPYLYFDPISISEDIALDIEVTQSSPAALDVMSGCLYPAVRKYNLLPPHYRIIQETHKVKNKVVLYLAMLLVFLIFFYLGIKLNMFYLEKITSNAKDAYLKTSPVVKKVEMINALMQEIAVLDKNISKIHSQYPDWIGILKELSNSIPNEIVLSNIESKIDTQGTILLLDGSVISKRGSLNTILNQFVEKLGKASYFSEIKILNTKNTSYMNELSFELKCLLD